MEHYGDFDTLRAAFDQFVEGLPFYGFAVLCTDHPEVQSLASRIEDRRVITYGFNAQADVRCENLKMTPDGSRFDVVFRYGEGEAERWSDMFLPMMGEHNVLNTVAAITVARELGADEASAKRALEGFGGVKRRFTRTGEWNGATIIDDYGHHPVEITAVLKAARQAATRRVIAVAQPHRYTRLRDLFEDFCTCFNEADSVLIADVYEAGEDRIEGFDRDHLVEGLKAHGHRDAAPTTRETLARDVAALAKPGDIVICLGAGDITAWAYALPDELKALG